MSSNESFEFRDTEADRDKKFKIRATAIVMIVFISMIALQSYVSMTLFKPPPYPKLDFNKCWGTCDHDDTSIRLYTIEFSDVIVNDLKERLKQWRAHSLIPPLNNTGSTYGFNTQFLTRVVDFWQNNYDFKEREHFLNKYDHYVTKIQGLDVHFLRVIPKKVDNVEVLPLLMIHGWPGSIREFYEIIPKLTTHRKNQKFVFEVIAPSIPGFGYSQAPIFPGMGPLEVATIFSTLMKRIGHNQYYVQGGGYGHSIGSIMATLFPNEVLGFHTNMPFVFYTNPSVFLQALTCEMWPRLFHDPKEEPRLPLANRLTTLFEETGYAVLQASKPDTIGVALSDSPAGLAAYILEKFSTWTDVDYRQMSDGGLLNKFYLTHLLDNIMIYWTTNSITTSMRHFPFMFKQIAYVDRIPTQVPTCGIKFKNQIPYQIDVVLKKKYPNYLHYTMVEDGGYFAAMEHPDILADDIYESVILFQEFGVCGLGKHDKYLYYLFSRLAYRSRRCSYDVASKRIAAPVLDKTPKTIYDFTVKDIKGNDVKLEKYRGHVLVIVNVASQCGFTDTHYTQLNELYEKYGQTRGLRILAFPCNQFGGQEPGTLGEIMNFAQNRNVKFDIFEKVEVNGKNTHPLWQFLKDAQGGTFGNFIKWNFSKFIVDKNGLPVERFGPNVNPLDMEPYLAKYW